jgi:predicted transcriptional regulator
MRKYVELELKDYIDPRLIIKFNQTQRSNNTDKYLNQIFTELTSILNNEKEEKRTLKDKVNTLEEALNRQQRLILKNNENKNRKEESRSEKIHRLRNKGYSQRAIAEEMGLSHTRVRQILSSTGNPLSKNRCNAGHINIQMVGESFQERNAKICEWWEQGYTQVEIASLVGLSRSRVAEIVSAQCTQMQKTDTISDRARQNGFHRNTQSKIEKIRKVAPRLARECERGEVKVSDAMRQCHEDLKRLNLLKGAKK